MISSLLKLGPIYSIYSFSIEHDHQSSEELPTDVELAETRLIQEGENIVELGPQRDFVLLVGITGAGKSTLGLLLSGDNRNLTCR